MTDARTDLASLQAEVDAADSPSQSSDALAALAEGRLLHGDDVGAAAAMREAIAQADAVADAKRHAEYAYALGLILSRSPQTQASARDALLDAAAYAHIVDDPTRAVAAEVRVARSFTETGDAAAALAAYDRAGTALDRVDVDTAVDVLMDRSRLAYGQGILTGFAPLLHQALADLDDAIARATAADRPDLAVRARVLHRMHATWVPGATPEPFSSLLEAVEDHGDLGLLGDLTLEQASQAIRDKRWEDAAALTLAAKDHATEAQDPVRYLMACMLIAEVREARGDRAGVIGILLTAKQSLERLLGPAAGHPLRIVLESLETRWGAEATQAALQAHIARVQGTAQA